MIIKAIYNGEIRRFSIDPVNFSELRKSIENVILGIPTNFVVKYTDEDGDLISVSTDAEFNEAVQYAKDGVLKISLHLPQQKTSQLPQPEPQPQPTQAQPEPQAQPNPFPNVFQNLVQTAMASPEFLNSATQILANSPETITPVMMKC
eukprot:TRINITY_DN2536_c0_g1_i4.p2 TRINITY_DN2536_c0_g1~~TRINITY_DN2536_c0_g1_i4.p2  ORF type:complete len:169 (-),score=60.81 TRINITY_DN2536_c0_g1_i4:556-999(-)